MSWASFFDALVNKIHVGLAALCQGAIIFYHFRTGHDIGAGVQNTVYGFYAFLAGHNLTNQKYPDAAAPGATNGQ